MGPVLSRAAVAKLREPEIPVLTKEIMGPSSYSSEEGFRVTLEELRAAPLIMVEGPIVGNDGSLITVSSIDHVSDNVIVLWFSKLTVNTGDGTVQFVPLEDGSDALEGVSIKILAFGDTTSVVYSESPQQPGEP